MAKSKDYERTCRKCGHRWFIPRALADEKAPNRMQVAGAKMGSAGANMSLVSFSRGRKQAKVQALEAQRVRVAENSRCPSCGASDFEQKKT